MTISKEKTYAIVGASNNPEKYGHKILRDMHNAGYKVIPINPKEKELIGLAVYQELSDVPEVIDTVITVVSPHVTEQVVKKVQELGIKEIWMQPGSESDAAIAYCEEHGIVCVHDLCIMIQSGVWKNN